MGARGKSDLDRWSDRCKQIAQDFEKAKAMTTLPPEIAEIERRNFNYVHGRGVVPQSAIDCGVLLRFITQSLRPIDRERVWAVVVSALDNIAVFQADPDRVRCKNPAEVADAIIAALPALYAAPEPPKE